MTEQLAQVVGDGERLALIAICTLTSVGNKPYATHLQFAYKLAKDNPEFQFILFTPYRVTIADFRNRSAEAALEVGAEYIMFIDDDAILLSFPSAFKELKKWDKHIISPIYFVRGFPFHPMFFKASKDPDMIRVGKGLEFYDDFRESGEIDKDGLLEVQALGCHCTLIKTEVFSALEKPYFLTTMHNTEDVYFCMKCRDYIENIEIFIDTKETVGHLLDPLWVDESNAKIMEEFYRKLGMCEALDWTEAYRKKDKPLAEGKYENI